MTNEEEWAIREARGRVRFQRAEYTIKDQYDEPGAPFFVTCDYIDCPVFQRLISDQAFDNELSRFARVGVP